MGTFVPTPQFPNVPKLPGVPQILRNPLDNNVPGALLPILSPTAETFLFRALFNKAPKWGIYSPSTNLRVVDADSVLSFDNRNEWKVSDFPIQNGQFASYNKVILPFEVSVRFCKTGTLADRQLFLQQIQNIAGDTNLYNVVTPELTYLNCNITRYEVMRRDNRDAFALWEVDVYLRNIQQVTAQFSTTQTLNANTANAQVPQAIPTVNQGITQGGPVPVGAGSKAIQAIFGAPL